MYAMKQDITGLVCILEFYWKLITIISVIHFFHESQFKGALTKVIKND